MQKVEQTVLSHEKYLLEMFDQGIIFIKNDKIEYQNTIFQQIEKKIRDNKEIVINTSFLDKKIFKL